MVKEATYSKSRQPPLPKGRGTNACVGGGIQRERLSGVCGNRAPLFLRPCHPERSRNPSVTRIKRQICRLGSRAKKWHKSNYQIPMLSHRPDGFDFVLSHSAQDDISTLPTKSENVVFNLSVAFMKFYIFFFVTVSPQRQWLCS